MRQIIRTIQLMVCAATVLGTSEALSQGAPNAQPGPSGSPPATDLGTVTVEATKAKQAPKAQPKQVASPGPQVTPQAQPTPLPALGTAALSATTIQQQSATSSYAQNINSIPGVTSYSRDASGLFGGGYSIRGFDSTQVGFSVDGVPLNDSGTFAVIPQVYTDPENLCSVVVTKGGAATQASQQVAMGGVVDVQSCAPSDNPHAKVGTSFGSNRLRKDFYRIDTGTMLGGALKGFVSYSKASTDYFAGPGTADRHHVDARFDLRINSQNSITVTGFYNEFVNTFTRTITKAQYEQNGYNWGWSEIRPPKLTGTTSPPLSNFVENQWELGKHAFVSATGKFTPIDGVTLEVKPYVYSQQSGSTSENVLDRGGATINYPKAGDKIGTFLNSGYANFTGNKALLGQMSQSDFDRLGSTIAVSKSVFDHKLTLSYWIERTYQQQRNPFQLLDPATGRITDIWFKSNLLLDDKGQVINSRAWDTEYTNQVVAIKDSFFLFDKALKVDLSLRNSISSRTFHNLANGASNRANAYLDYEVSRTFQNYLPGIGLTWTVDRHNQFFFNATQNVRVPPNFVDSMLVNTATRKVGQPVDVREERATSYDVGYRHDQRLFTFGSSAFLIDYTDRQAITANNDGTLTNTNKYTNIGATQKYGLEADLTVRPLDGLSVLFTASYTKDTIQDDVVAEGGAILPTKGKQYFNSPLYMLSAGLQYDKGPWFAFIRTKYTDKVFATLTNDVELPGYFLTDLGMGYRLKETELLKWIPGTPTDGMIKFNVNNVFQQQYLYINPGNSTNVQLTGAGTPSFYLGAPLSFVTSLSLEF